MLTRHLQVRQSVIAGSISVDRLPDFGERAFGQKLAHSLGGNVK
jgi:hypothetical protein